MRFNANNITDILFLGGRVSFILDSSRIYLPVIVTNIYGTGRPIDN
jgi:hypothetical protein